MSTVYDFLRRHPTGVDTVWAVLLLVMSVPALFRDSPAPATVVLQGRDGRLALVLVMLALCAVVALRRRRPEAMLLLAAGTGLVQLAANITVIPGDFAFLVITYTVASRNVRWASRLALAGSFVVPELAIWRWHPSYAGLVERGVASVFLTVPFLLAWVLGDSLRTRRAYYAQLEERATRLEKEREAHARIAAAAERARIARELHDVVAHNVSVMVVQADGAAYVLHRAPEQARQALETISGTGRQALAEMRRLLGVLRSGEDEGAGAANPYAADGGLPASGEYVPQPGVAQLGELVEAARGAGMTVHFGIEGTPRPLPSSVELTAYRLVQEALTNSRKHGGPEVTATVRLRYDSGELSLLAEDDGRGAGGASAPSGRDGADEAGRHEPGHGLIGMRERVSMVGGRLCAGPRPDGGFRISAVLPLKGAG